MGWALGSKSLNPPSHSVHFHSSISYCSRKLTTSYQEIRLYRTSWTPWLHTPIVHWMRGRWVYLYIVFRNAFWKCQNWIWNEIRFFIEHIRKCQSDLTLILLWIGLISNINGLKLSFLQQLDTVDYNDFVGSTKLWWCDWLELSIPHIADCTRFLLRYATNDWLFVTWNWTTSWLRR